MIRTYLFDLDMTLVDTNALATLRRARLWSQVKKNMHLARTFAANGKYAPHEIPALLHESGHKVGIVTNAPRWYAKAIAEQFQMPFDVLVAYEDTAFHKPDPAPLLKALRQLGRAASPSVVYVGDDVSDFEASYRAGISSIGVSWAPTSIFELSSAAPDILIDKPSLLLNADRLAALGYAGERASNHLGYIVHSGSNLLCDEDPAVYALGRYFTTADPRHAASPLCSAILKLKQNDEPAEMLGSVLGKVIARWDWRPRYIVPVPPKPSQTRRRFKQLLATAAHGFDSKTKVLLDGLKCTREIAGYKAMNALERQSAIKGAYTTPYRWNGNDVLLVDDVYTTGETTRECVRVLKRSGAGEVRCLVLGKDQRALEGKDCPSCGRPMRIRTKRSTGEKFWGCSGYPDDCRHTENVQ